MKLSCKLGFHKWVGCQCQVCGVKRDSEHSWDFCRCTICDRRRDGRHKWNRYICETCGAVRTEHIHIPSLDPQQSTLLEWKYLIEKPCLCGGAWQLVSHSSPIPSGVSEMVCKCSVCGMEHLFLFYLTNGPNIMNPEDDWNLKVAEEICTKAVLRLKEITSKNLRDLYENPLMREFMALVSLGAEEREIKGSYFSGLPYLAAGRNTSIIGYRPEGAGAQIYKGDEIILDFMLNINIHHRVNGPHYGASYCWVAGEEESELQSSAHKVLETVIEAAKQYISTGTVQTYEELNDVIIADIEDAGFGKYGYWHAIDDLERLDSRGEGLRSLPLGYFQSLAPLRGIIRDGDTIILKPGIYIPRRIGFKIGLTHVVKIEK